MPEPQKGESEADFLKKCIPALIHEGYENRSQVIAICYSKYRKLGTEAKSPKPEKKKLCKGDKCNVLLAHY